MEGRGSKGSTEQTRTRRVLVVTEFALSLVLMVAAGLLLRSFWDLYKAPLGFNPQHVMSVQLWLPSPNDPKTDIYGTAAQEAVFARELLRRSRLLPGVQEAALGSEPSIPLHHDGNHSALIVEGRQTQSKQPPLVERSKVTPEYFHLLGIPLLRGRLFNDGDDEQCAAGRRDQPGDGADLLAGRGSAGKAAEAWPWKGWGRPTASKTWITIVGVIADARTESLANASVPQIYLSLYQETPKELAIFLRGDLNASAIPEQVRAMVQSVNPELPVYGAQTLDDAVSASLAAETILDGDGGGLRGNGAAAGGAGNLRSDFLSRERAHARNRHSPGAGSATGEDPADGSAPGAGTGDCRRRGWDWRER